MDRLIVVFDLDDTLYPEITYVLSGFNAVAEHLSVEHGLPKAKVGRELREILKRDGRGAVFNQVLENHGLLTKARVRKLVSVYRSHTPRIKLPEESAQVLRACAAYPLYLVTDGNHRVQKRKVDALKVAPFFDHCYLTRRYGIDAEKPSLKVFNLIAERERVPMSSLVYIGDNPAKDFVGLRRAGGNTIRVLTGAYAATAARRGFDADSTIQSVGEVPERLSQLAIQ